MWLIPGHTKVKMELFKGVGIIDAIIGVIAVIFSIALFLSNFEFKFPIFVVFAFIVTLLVIRVDDEPNYTFLVRIIKHIAFPKRYAKPVRKAATVENEDDVLEESDLEIVDVHSKEAELKEFLDNDARLFSEEKRRLKDKDLTKEEEDAIWLARAKRSAEKKQLKREIKEMKTNIPDVEQITAFTGFSDGFIEYDGEYYGAAIEISPVEFRFFSSFRRQASINNGIAKILKTVNPNYSANIVKIDRPVHYDKYLEADQEKLEAIRTAYENGTMTEEEFKARVEIICDRMNELEKLVDEDSVVVPFFYLVLFDSDKGLLDIQIRNAVDDLTRAELPAKRLNTKELAVFLKYTNQIDFEESEIEDLDEADYAVWARPNDLLFKIRTSEINKVVSHTMRVTSYQSMVGAAWLASVMSIPGTKCVVKAKPMNMEKAVRGIDRSLSELRSRYSSTGVDSKLIQIQEHIDSLSELLKTIQEDDESLLEVNIYITAYDLVLSEKLQTMGEAAKSKLPRISSLKKTVKRIYRENGMRVSGMDFEQVSGYIGSQISGYDPFGKKGRGMPTSSISAAYPWIFSSVSDVGGIKLGSSDGVPVFVDFFRRDSERVNSNMVIVGKSGSGKSFAAKFILSNLAADDTKIFILDPENEYSELAENLHGKFINVGNAKYGRLNPFHIMTAIDDYEDGEETVSGSYATHLQFLEEFFKQILPDCEKDALEYLNSIVDRMYLNKGINAETNLSRLKPEDFPIFDDLYDTILQEFQKTDNEFIRSMLRTLMNYIAKFSSGGRNANIWNGPSTITTDENFSVFNFQSLLSNRNMTIANAQMLLVLKYIDNEIIKNRDYNIKNNVKRKAVVVIDEAHVFIDEKFPIALDFMFQLAKRIRKYNGMQIVLTQNIKDFVGTEELARKSTAIINASQYSLIFPLAPNDMTDLCTLYEKAGGINESEQEGIVQASRGQAFAVLSPSSRSSFKIDVPDGIRSMFEQRGYVSKYFGTSSEDEVWLDFLGDSKEKHMAVAKDKAVAIIGDEDFDTDTTSEGGHVIFEEIYEDNSVDTLATDDVVKFEEVEENTADSAVEDTTTPTKSSKEEAYDRELELEAFRREAMAMRMQKESRTEEMLAEMLAKMSDNNIEMKIQQVIEQEVQKRVAEAMRQAGAVSMVNTANSEVEAVPATSVAQTTSTASSDDDSDFFDDFFNDLFDEDAKSSNDRTTTSEAADDKATDTFDDAIDTDDSGFDIMAILEAEAEKMAGVSPIEQMDLYDEKVIDITIEDLTKYINNAS